MPSELLVTYEVAFSVEYVVAGTLEDGAVVTARVADVDSGKTEYSSDADELAAKVADDDFPGELAATDDEDELE